MVVGSLVVGGAGLIAADSPVVGALFIAGALLWMMTHTAVVAWISRKKKRD